MAADRRGASARRRALYRRGRQVRRFDDEAKDPGAQVRPFSHFAALLTRLAR